MTATVIRGMFAGKFVHSSVRQYVAIYIYILLTQNDEYLHTHMHFAWVFKLEAHAREPVKQQQTPAALHPLSQIGSFRKYRV